MSGTWETRLRQLYDHAAQHIREFTTVALRTPVELCVEVSQ